MSFTTLDDVIKFAVQREETAYRLYQSAAQKATSISSRKMFEELAHEEAAHKVSFERLDLGVLENHTFSKEVDMKLAEYMVDIPFREDLTYAEILHYAMKTEEYAYKLYLTAAENTPDLKVKKMLLLLADVEKGHKQRIEDIYDERVLTEG
jgi:rubrerythrin